MKPLEPTASQMQLPVRALRGDLEQLLAQTNRIVVEAPTGSGKSTQIPQMLLENPAWTGGQILILQPRRLAARMLADRVAKERSVRIGEEVGYHIRLDQKSGPSTKILFVTEGILLRRLLRDPQLQGVSAVILDEFHERHLHGDIGLALCLELQEKARPDLQVLVMSATLDGSALLDYLGPTARLLSSEGRVHPVEIVHLDRAPDTEPVWDLAARLLRKEFFSTPGHALVFMPGAYEIRRTVQALRADFGSDVPIFPLHGEMPAREQDEAVAVQEQKKIIVSTNVAETSLTIDGITLVVDSGLARRARFDPHRGLDTLLIERISRASAEQRAGRAGRTAPGKCLRLWTIYDHQKREHRERPEIQRLDLAETLLLLKASGVVDAGSFRWMDPPDPVALERAETLLRDLGATQPDGSLTPVGKKMVSFPVPPRYARMFLEADRLGCVRAAALAAAFTQTRGILLRVDRKTEEERMDLFGGGSSDFGLLFRAHAFAQRNQFRTDACRRLGIHADAARQVSALFEQFLQLAQRVGLSTEAEPAGEEALGKCLLAGFADQVARRRSVGNYLCDVAHGRRGTLPKTSLAGDSWLIVAAEINEIGKGSGETEVQLGLATAIEEEWLRELFPEDFTEQRELLFDETQKRVVQRRKKVFRDLVVEQSDRDAGPGPDTAACLAREILEGRMALSGWDGEVDQWLERVNFLARVRPDLELPSIGEEEKALLIEQICEDATCFRDLKDRPVRAIVRSWLRPDQLQLVEKFAPARISLPGGKTARVSYGSNDARISCRIQELFGLSGALTVAGGKIPLVVEVLAPNHRPVQVTSDLKTFWAETYPKLKPQLQRRYPKHRWE